MPDPMTLKSVIIELSELHKTMDARTKKAEAVVEAIRILAAMLGEGCTDFDTVLDILKDYEGLAKQYQGLHRQFEMTEKPIYKDGVWHCPACNSRIQPNHSYCHRCGKKVGWDRYTKK